MFLDDYNKRNLHGVLFSNLTEAKYNRRKKTKNRCITNEDQRKPHLMKEYHSDQDESEAESTVKAFTVALEFAKSLKASTTDSDFCGMPRHSENRYFLNPQNLKKILRRECWKEFHVPTLSKTVQTGTHRQRFLRRN